IRYEFRKPAQAPEGEALYLISFNANGGTGTMTNAIATSGEYTLPDCTFTAPANKQFKSWSVGGSEKAVGDKITVTADTTVIAIWQEIIIYGDIDGDSYVSVSDVIRMLQSIANGDIANLTATQKSSADVNCDGNVDVSDVIRILQHIASPDTTLGPNN
ncbi:MAG: InlB B-repeat-containing protein, partial [Clostridia bacterium]|nr:InlB B-repeat-containing protein [Clostridia bacterium]